MAKSGVSVDKYRSFLSEEELNSTKWNAGPPNYDVVNNLFEQGRTKIWPAGSVEEYVQNLIKTWEMELVHKADPNDYKTLDPKKFTLGLNGKKYYTLEEIGMIGGSYNVFLQTSLPPPLRFFDPDKETYDSSQTAFKRVFPRGFAIEIVQVYSGPPLISYKFRHWGYMEGPFQGHAPTGELVELFGISIVELDENKKVVKIEFFYDRGELLAGLLKGETSDESAGVVTAASACPFMA
ncbi:hypothetical protein C2S53_004039 [Perilla frutescens var. hirtella]|uniref:Pathogen-related protein n=1 Tax=Perilla frutescens var. hirtella TaxID=608512 RepID=A0AAD4IZW1_PERFH|nr:hypothetical protein C2S53_004039 [Perilla frutescens var. hirtella]